MKGEKGGGDGGRWGESGGDGTDEREGVRTKRREKEKDNGVALGAFRLKNDFMGY